MKLSKALEKYRDEWIAFRIVDNGEDPTGDVVIHDKDRSKFEERLRADRVRAVYITFAGEPIAEGYVAMF